MIAHEVAHVISIHVLRRSDRRADLWNVACDYAVNGLLVASCLPEGRLNGVAAMPSVANPNTGRPQPIGLWDKRFVNWTAESIYEELERNTIALGLNWDELLEPSSDRDRAEAATHARAAVAKSLIRAREHRQQHSPGTKPGDWERMADEGLHPTVPWQHRLRQCALAWGYDTISWNRPNPKYRPHGLHFPRHRGYQLPNILFAFDTSGSVSDRFLGCMVAELNSLLALARSSVVRVVCCDADVKIVGDFHASRRLDPARHTLRGGGGTDFRPVFEYARREKRFRCLIYFTDSFGIYPETPPPGLDTLWLVPQGTANHPPFGKVISLPFSIQQK